MWNNSPLENPGMDNRERSRYGRTEERSDPSRGYLAPGVCNERGAGGTQNGTRGCSFMESPTSVFNASYPGGMSRQTDVGRHYQNPNVSHVHNFYPNNPARQNYPSSGASSPQMGYQDYSAWNSRPDVEMPNYPDRGFVIGPQNSRPQFGNIGPGVCETGPPRGIYPLRPYSNVGPRPMLPPMGDPYAPRPAFPPSGFPPNLPPASQPQYPGQPGHISPKPPRPGFPDQPRYY